MHKHKQNEQKKLLLGEIWLWLTVINRWASQPVSVDQALTTSKTYRYQPQKLVAIFFNWMRKTVLSFWFNLPVIPSTGAINVTFAILDILCDYYMITMWLLCDYYMIPTTSLYLSATRITSAARTTILPRVVLISDCDFCDFYLHAAFFRYLPCSILWISLDCVYFVNHRFIVKKNNLRWK